jgi:Leucine-rich repeat (LRR) protein
LQITTLLTNFNISLQANKNAGGALGRKNDEGNGKTENKRKKEVKLVCTALFLNNNQIRSIKGLNDVLQFVMFNPSKLEWLDLSYNYLQNIDKELLNFPNLKTLYLHGNYIQNLDEARKLQDLPQLQSLNLYGNFIEQVKGYRLWILGMMYEKHETLKKLDNVLVTRKEFDTVIVWNERLFESQK